jgi:DNA-binding response OmpR family regulator
MIQTISPVNTGDPANRLEREALTTQVLLIETDDQLAQLLSQELIYDGYHVSWNRDGISGLLTARQTNPHIIIVTWALPGISCLEFCHRLRSTYNSVPIVVLTSEGQTDERIMSLDAGASDCLSKPFAIEELIARIRAHLRHRQKEANLLRFDQLVLHPRARQVYYGTQEIELTAKEFDLLEYLMQHANQVLTREQILDRVWGYESSAVSNVVEVYIRYLRNKLQAKGAKQLIRTVRSVGYVLRS